MPNALSLIYLQFIFAVKGRQNLIRGRHKEELHRDMTSLVQDGKAKVLAVHCMPDHMHLFVGFRATISMDDFVKEVKEESSEIINAKKWIEGSFSWQEEYAAFSYGQMDIDSVCKFIRGQEAYHMNKTFRTELLEEFEVPYEEQDLFEFIE